MKQYEVLSLIILYSVFGIILFSFELPFYLGIFDGFITGTFYFLGLAVPLYFFVRFIMKRTLKAFKLVIVASMPMITFIGIIIIILIQLARALEHF